MKYIALAFIAVLLGGCGVINYQELYLGDKKPTVIKVNK